jgi:hypothetical protein
LCISVHTHIYPPGLPMPMASAWVGSALLGALLCSALLSIQSCSALCHSALHPARGSSTLLCSGLCSALLGALLSALPCSALCFPQRIALLSTLFCSSPLCSVLCSAQSSSLKVICIKNSNNIKQNNKNDKSTIACLSLPGACSPLHCALVLYS